MSKEEHMRRYGSSRRLPAEWEEQDGVLLVWPHAATDWAPYLDLVERVYVQAAVYISRFERVVVIVPEQGDTESLSRKLIQAGAIIERVRIFAIEANDTWVRDFGPIQLWKTEVQFFSISASMDGG